MAGAQLMADCEYGRVFTEADVKLLMAFAYLEGRDGKSYGQDAEGNAIDRGAHLLAEWQRMADDPQGPFDLKRMLTFPADEPVFVLRGQDLAAADGLVEYKATCEALGTSDRYLNSVEAAIQAFLRFPGPTKVPE
jgi:hypothetical protein